MATSSGVPTSAEWYSSFASISCLIDQKNASEHVSTSFDSPSLEITTPTVSLAGTEIPVKHVRPVTCGTLLRAESEISNIDDNVIPVSVAVEASHDLL